MTDEAESKTTSGLERALDVLLLFARPDPAPRGVSEVARDLGLSKAVVHRILTTLRSRRLIELDESTRRYSLGPAALALSMAYLDQIDIRDLAREPLRRLMRSTNETSTLSIRTGDTRIYLDQVTPPREVKMTVPLGRPFPLHAGASSKAFLAFLPEAEQEDYLTGRALEALTDHTVIDATPLRHELAVIRDRGYAVSFGERQVGAGSVAAPVLDQESAPAAVLSVSGPVERIRGRVDDLSAVLLAETRELSVKLGHPRRLG